MKIEKLNITSEQLGEALYAKLKHLPSKEQELKEEDTLQIENVMYKGYELDQLGLSIWNEAWNHVDKLEMTNI